MAIELGTHTDCRNTFDYNKALSQRRADSAVAYIMKSGINPFRLSAKGYGESQLLNKCECEGG
jgi:outer membrane protein OmpA-like peptidoglycan-associated protein